jgi:hypothetical protein
VNNISILRNAESLQCIGDYRVSGPHPSSGILKDVTYLIPTSGEGWEEPAVLGSSF